MSELERYEQLLKHESTIRDTQKMLESFGNAGADKLHAALDEIAKDLGIPAEVRPPVPTTREELLAEALRTINRMSEGFNRIRAHLAILDATPAPDGDGGERRWLVWSKDLRLWAGGPGRPETSTIDAARRFSRADADLLTGNSGDRLLAILAPEFAHLVAHPPAAAPGVSVAGTAGRARAERACDEIIAE